MKTSSPDLHRASPHRDAEPASHAAYRVDAHPVEQTKHAAFRRLSLPLLRLPQRHGSRIDVRRPVARVCEGGTVDSADRTLRPMGAEH
jgi:hypothetical protein